MGWYRSGKLAFDVFHSFSSRVVTKPQISQLSSRICKSEYLTSVSRLASFSGFMSFPSISQRLGLRGKVNRDLSSPFLGGARRFYYVDRHNVQHFKPRGPRWWFHNLRHVLNVVLVGSGVLITVHYGNLETIPYTKRTHLILNPKSMERRLGEFMFQKRKEPYEITGKILPATHPESKRVRMIAKDIVDALQRGLRKEDVWSDLGYASEHAEVPEGSERETLNALTKREVEVEGKRYREDEIVDNKWVQKSRKKSEKLGSEPDTSHLDGLNWEVLVVNEPDVNAFYSPGGKIVVFTGLLEHFRSDAEIATILGHEVGHLVARHYAERITKAILQIIFSYFAYQLIPSWSRLIFFFVSIFLALTFCRRMEIEADYIGMLLIASAGYDPRVAPMFYEKLGKVIGDSALWDYLLTHPSGKKRAQLLAQSQVMEEALTLYENVTAGRGVEGFL